MTTTMKRAKPERNTETTLSFKVGDKVTAVNIGVGIISEIISHPDLVLAEQGATSYYIRFYRDGENHMSGGGYFDWDLLRGWMRPDGTKPRPRVRHRGWQRSH